MQPLPQGSAPARTRALKAALLAATMFAGFGAAGAQANEIFFNLNKNSVSSPQNPSLFLFGDVGTAISVTNQNGFSQDVILDGTGFFNMALPLSEYTSGTGISNKGFTIVSPVSIGAYLVNRNAFTSDMAYLFGGDGLGKNYVVASQGGGFGEGSQMSVMASQDGTTVTVTPKGSGPIVVALDKGQVYAYAGGATNLTGSLITADKPIAVFGGHECAQVPVGTSYCDNLVEQMPAVEKLSKSYVVSKTENTGSAGNLIRVISPTDGNEIKVNGVVVATLAKGDFYEFTLLDGATIEGSSPVLVAQYLKGQDATSPDVSDPALSFVPGRDSWLKAYRLATPSGAQGFLFDWADIVIESSDLPSLTLNGVDVDDSLFTGIAGTTLKRGNVALPDGVFAMAAANPFQLLLAGFDSFDTYMTIGGTNFAVGASPPPPPPPDGIPEPETLALFGLGLAGLFVARRRKRA